MGRHRKNPSNAAAIAQDNEAAKAAGLTYGKYKSMIWQHGKQGGQAEQPKAKKRKKSYTDEAAFLLWKQGKTDKEIGIALGVSRQNIQRWRSIMELPSNRTAGIDTSLYRAIKTKHGVFVERIPCRKNRN